MRSLPLLLVILAACGDNNAAKNKPDAATSGGHHDAKVFEDAKVFMDAPPNVGDGIQEVRSAADGTVDLNVTNVTVTFVRPLIGSTTNDPAGFYVQSVQTGPALYVEVDPTTLTPVPVPGDVVSFHVTAKETPGTSMQPRAKTIDNFTRSAQGADLSALVQDISNATDVVSAVGNYDSELVTVTGTLVGPIGGSGLGFSKFELDTAGITGNANLQFRLPTTVAATVDPIAGCTVTATNAILNRFAALAEVQVINASDFHIACSESVVSAVATSPTSVQLTFARNVDTATVLADGSQFTADGSLTLSGPVVSNNLITLTTSAQTPGTTYTITVANTVKDIDGNVVMAPGTVMFNGFKVPAVVTINELNANITGGCDLIELRVIADGDMGGFKVQERTGNAGSMEMSLTFPTGFTVHKNDYIVVHMNSASTTCNPGGATMETLTKTDQAAATFTGNYDTAFDFWSADTGLVATDNVITLYDATNAIVDALIVAQAPTGTAAANSETQAAAVIAVHQWLPDDVVYLDDVFRMHAVQDLDATGPTAAGNSIQRVTDVDTNAVADWTTGAGVASTWGANNAGQADIP